MDKVVYYHRPKPYMYTAWQDIKDRFKVVFPKLYCWWNKKCIKEHKKWTKRNFGVGA